jgi:hypothetical protein
MMPTMGVEARTKPSEASAKNNGPLSKFVFVCGVIAVLFAVLVWAFGG